MSRRSWLSVAGASLVCALALLTFREVLVREPNRAVNVRWHASVDAPARAALERKLGLEPLQDLSGFTWRYELLDSSPAAIRRLVMDPFVDDTHFIDRTDFFVEPGAPDAPRRPGQLGERWPALAFALADYGPALFIIIAAVTALFGWKPDVVPTLPVRAVGFLTRGVPVLSARDLALFRLAFGLALAVWIYLRLFPLDVVPPELQRPGVAIEHLAPIRWLVNHPAVVRAGQYLAMAAAVLFAAGLRPRLTYALATAGIVQWLLARSTQEDGHVFGVLILPLVFLLTVPWDAKDEIPSKRYGYAPWMLSLALGVAWAAAAWAKLKDGPGWVLNGAVRYHFVTDYSHAHVDWGLAIAAMPRVAIILSACAVLIEALTLTTAFVKRPVVRLAFGLAAMSLLMGFYLFQGIMWRSWWILLLGFVPWQWFNAASRVPAARQPIGVSSGQLACAVALLAQQLIVSAAFVEFPPLASRYDMYSKAHESPAEFERENPPTRRQLLAVDRRGRTVDITDCEDNFDPDLVDLWKFNPAAPPPTARLRLCDPRGLRPEKYLVVEDRCGFDWNAGRFYCAYQDKVIGTLPVRN